MSATTIEAPPVAAITPDDLLRLPDRGKGLELVHGELKELNASFLSSYVAGRVFARLNAHVESRNLGWVSPEGTSFRCFPDDRTRVRRADTAFHRLERLTAAQATTEGHCVTVPDLVVEVVSPNDLADDVNGKRVEWLEAGAALVWVVYPIQQQVHSYPAAGPVRIFGSGDTLTAEPLIPGLEIPVADLFRLPVAGS